MPFPRLLVFLLAFLSVKTGDAQSIHGPLRDGDKAYDREQYKAAEKQYRTAADRDMGNPKAVYNLSNALYQQGNFEDAEERYKQVARSANPGPEMADALHNLGNASLKQQKYKEAVQAYEASLRLRPGDEETKRNLQMAKKKLKKEEEQQKQQQKQQQEQQQQENQDPQQQDQGTQDQKDPQQNQPPKPEEENPQGQPQEPKEQQKRQEEQKLKKEDAKRLLETAIGPDDRKNAQKYRAAQQQNKPKGSKKDW